MDATIIKPRKLTRKPIHVTLECPACGAKIAPPKPHSCGGIALSQARATANSRTPVKEFRQVVSCPRCKGQPSLTHCPTCDDTGYVHVFAILDLGRVA